MLIVFGGLPGTGRSTIAKALAARNRFTYVRIDEIENALALHVEPKRNVGAEGYHVAFAVASSNLRLGNTVVADSVNPVQESRNGWRQVAEQAGAPLLEVECVCSDEAEHRRRVETRLPDVTGWTLPTWDEVRTRRYEHWNTGPLVIDTALSNPEEAVRLIEDRIVGHDFLLLSNMSTIPTVGAFAIVPNNDLHAAIPFWERLGFSRTGGEDDYVIMTGWDCEVHLTQAGDEPWRVSEKNNRLRSVHSHPSRGGYRCTGRRPYHPSWWRAATPCMGHL